MSLNYTIFLHRKIARLPGLQLHHLHPFYSVDVAEKLFFDCWTIREKVCKEFIICIHAFKEFRIVFVFLTKKKYFTRDETRNN